ncbi:MAG: hypothetical protein PWQ85_1614 [Geotoga sp.]|nr:hypothetical protein [Geotoga sp.]
MVISVMDEYFPEYEKIYKNIFSEVSIKFLKTHPFPKEIIEVGIEKNRKSFERIYKWKRLEK